MRLLTIVVLLSFACSMSIGQEPSAQKTGTKQLIGLWRAKRIFGPEARGPLIIYKTSAGWKADFMGVVHSVVVKGKTISFEVPNDQGSFSGTFEGSNIFGQWVSGRANGENWTGVSPVALTPAGPNRWTGSVDPPDQEFTLFLFIQKQPDGTFSAIMRNPDRDVGAQMGVSRIVLDDNKVTVFGKRGNRPESIVSTGSYDPEEQRLSLYIANRGGHQLIWQVPTLQQEY